MSVCRRLEFGRRSLIAGAGAVLWPGSAFGQVKAELPKIAFVFPGPHEAVGSRVEALVSGLRASGFARSQLELTVRSTGGDPALVAPLVAEAIGKGASVIVAGGPTVLQSAIASSRDVIVVALDLETDPVASRLASSLGRPGGNVTGVFLDFPNFAGKWLELLTESVPKLARIGVLWDPVTGGVQIDAVKRTAAGLAIQADVFETRTRADLENAVAAAREKGAEALVITSSPLIPANVKHLADAAIRHRLPAITLFPDFARAGGLMAYGPNLLTMYRQLGVMAGKVLRGEKAADLPIERPSKFELVLNQRTAETIGISLPLPVLLRADEVID